MTDGPHGIEAAEIVLPCSELDETVAFFTDRLGFRVDAIIPADDPSAVVVSGHGLRVRLERGAPGAPGVLRLLARDRPAGPRELIAPNGTRIELVESDPPLVLPQVRQSFVLTRMSDGTKWGVGRAGMRYRDLIPDRQGGRFIASHIQIPDSGPVPDYVHYHRVRFQAIFCYRGWVRVAYEDQGPPLVMNEGDCVLQPPQIRHRVLECSPGLEVIEIGCPAVHETRVDHELDLPTASLRPGRAFGGQRFVYHVASTAQWRPWRLQGFEARDTGIAAATDGLAGMQVVRPLGTPEMQTCSVDTEFLFMFVLRGTAALHHDGRCPERLVAGDCFVAPAGMRHGLAECSGDLELLEVSLPAVFETDLNV